MRISHLLLTQNIINAKIAHLAWKVCAFFFNLMCEITHRAALTLSLEVIAQSENDQNRATPGM